MVFASVTLLVCADIFKKHTVFWTNLTRRGVTEDTKSFHVKRTEKTISTTEHQGYYREHGTSLNRTEIGERKLYLPLHPGIVATSSS